MKGLQKQWNYRKLAAALLGAGAGAAVFLWVYGAKVLDPGWDAWILASYDEGDIWQHYAGWMLYRISNWRLPIGMADAIAMPHGTLISYTDSLPWVSMLFRLFRHFLPQKFQWFGLYTFLCFCLQGMAGALLASRGALQKRGGLLLALGGGGLFACMPALWDRAFRHTALGSHYLYLFALYFYLEYRTRLRAGKDRFPWQFAVLAFLAVGIHPYFMPLVCMCSLLAAVDTARIRKDLRGAALQFGGTLAAAYAAGLLTGAISKGAKISREGFGFYSMNLNAPFNPWSAFGYDWSRLLPDLPAPANQYDGFNYIGLGAIVLPVLALVYALCCQLRSPAGARAWRKRNGPLLAACLFLTLFAASNTVCFFDWSFTVPLPQWLLDLCGIFRASGRMFYLVTACLYLFGIYTLREACGRLRGGALPAGILLALVLALQAWDLSAVAAQKRALFDPAAVEAKVSAVLRDPLTQDLGQGHLCLYTVPWVDSIGHSRLLGLLAGEQQLRTNLSLFPPAYVPQAVETSENARQELAQGRFDPNAVYASIDPDVYAQWQQVFAGDERVHLFEVDGIYFLSPVAGGD